MLTLSSGPVQSKDFCIVSKAKSLENIKQFNKNPLSNRMFVSKQVLGQHRSHGDAIQTAIYFHLSAHV